MKYLSFFFIFIMWSCEPAKPIIIRNVEQTKALQSDTMFLNFRLYMFESEYKVCWAKNFLNKKIVELNDGSYRYSLNINGSDKYALIEPEFLNDSLVSIELSFTDNVGSDLLLILRSKYGSESSYSKEYEYYSWKDDSTRKDVTLHTQYDSKLIYKDFESNYKVYEKKEKVRKLREDSLNKILKKEL